MLNKLLDKLSDALAHRKGLLPLVGIGLIVINYVVQFIPGGWIGETNLLMHLGLVTAILGLILARAL